MRSPSANLIGNRLDTAGKIECVEWSKCRTGFNDWSTALKGILARAPAPPCGNTMARAATIQAMNVPALDINPSRLYALPHAQSRLAEYSSPAALA